MTCIHHSSLKDDSCIRQVPVFEELTEQEVIILQKVIQSRRYEKGEFIFREGDFSELLFVLHKGIVKVSKCSGSGKEQVIRLLYSGDFFGQIPLLQKRMQYANAEALEPASVCLIHRTDLNKIMVKNPAITYRFLLAISDRLQQADEWMSSISLLEVEKRLARKLLLLYQKGEFSTKLIIKLPIAKKELASILGTTPETLSRKLAYFESMQILSLENRNRIRILDLNKLMEIAST